MQSLKLFYLVFCDRDDDHVHGRDYAHHDDGEKNVLLSFTF